MGANLSQKKKRGPKNTSTLSNQNKNNDLVIMVAFFKQRCIYLGLFGGYSDGMMISITDPQGIWTPKPWWICHGDLSGFLQQTMKPYEKWDILHINWWYPDFFRLNSITNYLIYLGWSKLTNFRGILDHWYSNFFCKFQVHHCHLSAQQKQLGTLFLTQRFDWGETVEEVMCTVLLRQWM